MNPVEGSITSQRVAKMEKALHSANTVMEELLGGADVTFGDPEFVEDIIFTQKLIQESLQQSNELN